MKILGFSKISHRGVITIPKKVMKILDLKTGSSVRFNPLKDGLVELIPDGNRDIKKHVAFRIADSK